MATLINNVEDYIAAVQIIHEFFKGEAINRTAKEITCVKEIQDEILIYEEEVGKEFLQMLTPYECYRLSEKVYFELTGGISVRQITLNLTYKALRSAGLSDIPF